MQKKEPFVTREAPTVQMLVGLCVIWAHRIKPDGMSLDDWWDYRQDVVTMALSRYRYRERKGTLRNLTMNQMAKCAARSCRWNGGFRFGGTQKRSRRGNPAEAFRLSATRRAREALILRAQARGAVSC